MVNAMAILCVCVRVCALIPFDLCVLTMCFEILLEMMIQSTLSSKSDHHYINEKAHILRMRMAAKLWAHEIVECIFARQR